MTPPHVAPRSWRTARGDVRLDHRPFILGVINVTPDSFHDASRHRTVDAALRHAARLIEDGADMLDVGGESTRPGAHEISAREEIDRVVPVVAALTSQFPDVLVSVDTVKSDVGAAALDAGAAVVNDVSGLRLDPRMADVVAQSGAGIILMHSRGSVESMARYDEAAYDDVTGVVAAELVHSISRARAAGIADDAIVVDPGLGFAKRSEHSMKLAAQGDMLIAEIERLAAARFPLLVGPSRKRFTGEHLAPEARLPGTIAACVVALLGGASLFRVHDVLEMRRALDVAAALRDAAAHDVAAPAGAVPA